MKLYFTCRESNKVFGSEDYSLLKDYTIVDKGENQRELKGIVILNTGCPLCGQKHRFEVEDVICPLSREDNEK